MRFIVNSQVLSHAAMPFWCVAALHPPACPPLPSSRAERWLQAPTGVQASTFAAIASPQK